MRVSFSLGSLLNIPDISHCIMELKKEPDTIWIPETWGMENFSMLCLAATKTSDVKIGSSIINIYSRSPSLIAMGAATIDTISHGRMVLGLGTSSLPIVENFHGQKFTNPLTRMREYVEIIRLVLGAKPVNYNGRHFNLKNFSLLIRPYREKIPIYLASVNQKMTELAWDVADGVIFYLRPQKEMKSTIQKMQSKRKIDVTCQIITAVSKDSEKAITRAKKTLSFYIAVGKVYRDFIAKHGYENETSAVYSEYKKSGLANIHEYISDSMLHDLTICGTPDDVKKQLHKFVDTGIDLPIIQFNPVSDTKDSFRLLQETFADV